MIINGGAAGNVGWWGDHLTSEKNDRAELKETKGLLSEDVHSALREMQAVASGSRSQGNFMYQANINPEKDEYLTEAQWKDAFGTLEKNLGLEGHQRIVVEHEKEGRVHRHAIWNRVDVDTLRVADIGGNWYTHEHTARELEGRFGLHPTPSLHGAQRPDGRPDRAPDLAEIRAQERSGIDRTELKAELTELWRTTDSGKAFAAAIEERGYILARGDRRDFCIVDQAGDAHSLARRIEGVKAANVRERMADIDREALPTVAEARAQQRDRHPTHEAAQKAWEEQRRPAHADRQQTAPEPRETPTEALEGAAKGAAKVGITVLDAASDVVEKLADFLDGLLGGASEQPPPPPPSQIEQIREQRRALAALQEINRSLQQGQSVEAASIRSLTPSHLQQIANGGDEALRRLAQWAEADRTVERDWGRERER